MDEKLKQSKAGLETDDEVRLMKGKIARKDKETNDIKRKTEISENNYKRLRDEVMKLQIELEERKKLNKEKDQKIKEKTIILNETEGEMRKS